MADPDHVAIVKQGAEIIMQWRQKHQDKGFDLTKANLQEVDLTKAMLREANLTEADLTRTDLRGATLAGANLARANLTEANLAGADLGRANLTEADLTRVNLTNASLFGANLTGSNLREARLRAAYLSKANLTNIIGAEHIIDLARVRLGEEGDALYFDECRRLWIERWFDWESLRTLGRLPLFGISYTVLILIPIAFYGLAVYNHKVRLMRAWAETLIVTPDHPMHRVTTLIRETLHQQPIPSLSLTLLISTVFLAAGSTLFTFFCPPRILEFRREQWCEQMQRSLLHYWPLAWARRWIRLVCAVCYALGGAGAFWVIGNKLWRVARFIIENSIFPWPWR